jgi:hypothetical protein
MAHTEVHLPSKHEALSSNPTTTKTKKLYYLKYPKADVE